MTFKQYSSEIILISTGSILLISLEFLILTTNLNRSIFIFELLFFLPFFIYLFAIFLFKHENSRFSRSKLLIILGFAFIFQIIILFTNVSLSDDIYRFFYEGKGLVNGVNPYITPIEEFPDNLRDSYYDKVNNPHITSPYPPLALLLFAILYLIFPNPFIYRVCFSFGFLVSMLVFYKLVSPNSKWKLIIYAWNPLLHLETANGSHFEAIVVLLVMLALWSLYSERFSTAGVFLLLGFLLKYYPLFLIVVYWKKLGKKGLTVFFSGVFLYCLLVILYPYTVFGVLIYAETWYFNASIFWVIVQITQSFFLTKIILGGIFIILLCFITLKSNKEAMVSLPTMAYAVIGIFLLFQPSFHPWYVFWVFPFVLLDKKSNYSWILLSGLLVFSYHVYIAYDTVQIWTESIFLRFIEYFPFYTCLAIENRVSISKLYYSIIDRFTL